MCWDLQHKNTHTVANIALCFLFSFTCVFIVKINDATFADYNFAMKRKYNDLYFIQKFLLHLFFLLLKAICKICTDDS